MHMSAVEQTERNEPIGEMPRRDFLRASVAAAGAFGAGLAGGRATAAAAPASATVPAAADAGGGMGIGDQDFPAFIPFSAWDGFNLACRASKRPSCSTGHTAWPVSGGAVQPRCW